MRLTGIYSPPPIKVGQFDTGKVEELLAKRIDCYDCDDREVVDLPLDSLGIRFYAGDDYMQQRFEPLYAMIEPAKSLTSLKQEEAWHYDQTDGNPPVRIIFGATVRPPDVLTGYFLVPTFLYESDPELLSEFMHSDDGQSSIEDGVDKGNLEPVTSLSAGDLALFNLYALHRRCDFGPEDATSTRLVLRSFELP